MGETSLIHSLKDNCRDILPVKRRSPQEALDIALPSGKAAKFSNRFVSEEGGGRRECLGIGFEYSGRRASNDGMRKGEGPCVLGYVSGVEGCFDGEPVVFLNRAREDLLEIVCQVFWVRRFVAGAEVGQCAKERLRRFAGLP